MHFTLKQLHWHKCWHQSDLRQSFCSPNAQKKKATHTSVNIGKSAKYMPIQKTKSRSDLSGLLWWDWCALVGFSYKVSIQTGVFAAQVSIKVLSQGWGYTPSSTVLSTVILLIPFSAGVACPSLSPQTWSLLDRSKERHWRATETSIYTNSMCLTWPRVV